MSQYIDDSSIIHTSDIEEANATHEKIKTILQDHGFVLNLDKECLPSRKQKILGFIIDTDEMKVYCDPKKFVRIHEALFYMQGRAVPIKNLASVLGKIISLTPALRFPPQSFLYKTIRYLSGIVGESNKEDWDVQVKVPIAVLQEVTFVTNSLSFWSGRSIDFIKETATFKKEEIDDPAIKHVEVFAGDAGKDAVCIYNVRRKYKFKHTLFNLSLKDKSSNYRELQVEMSSDFLVFYLELFLSLILAG